MKVPLRAFVSAFAVSGLAAFCAAAAFVVHSHARDAISDAFAERMSGIGNTAASFSDPAELGEILDGASASSDPAAWARSSALYAKYHAPLSKTMRDTGASFLYLFLYGGPSDIEYVVDATPMDSEIWAPPTGAEESAPEDLREGLFHAFRGEGGATGVFDSVQWGLMRSGTYPAGRGGRNFFMAGVDVRAEDIRELSRAAALKIGGVFAALSALALLLSAALSGAVSKSAARLRRAALLAAAGRSPGAGPAGLSGEIGGLASELSKKCASADSRMAEISSWTSAAAASRAAEAAAGELSGGFAGRGFDLSFEDCGGEMCAACAEGGMFFAFSVRGSRAEPADALRLRAFREAVAGLSRRPDCLRAAAPSPGGSCAAFDSRGRPVFACGAGVSADFEFSEGGAVARAVFSFACGGRAELFAKGGGL